MEGIYEPNLTQSVIPSFWVAVDSIDRYSDIATALNDYFNQQQAMFVTGELDVNDDAEWKNYVDGLYSLGLEDWLNIRGIETIAE
jgi:putative aldouronate transport system substrate-binding protein